MKWIQLFNYATGKIFNASGARINLSLNYLQRKRTIDRNYLDYVRLATLELVADSLQKRQLTGAVAELGVYKGKFARYINQYFPGSNLYLFDTFEGFDTKDVSTEVQNNFSSGAQDFSNTSVTEVLKRMPFPDKCIVRKGFFPDTAGGLEDEFIFVSIDADLYEPIYAGLQYFYPRLKKGGYIFVHDYNNDEYKGAAKAVDQYCRENNLTLLPLPDTAGTAILVK